MQKYRKRFDATEEVDKWQILERTMIYVGRLTWVIHSKYPTAGERNLALRKLKNKEGSDGIPKN